MGDKIPIHVAIIPDGNRRWAKAQGLAGSEGHKRAIEKEKLISLLNKAQEIGVKYLSLWGFSTENWKRGALEKQILFKIFIQVANDMKEYAHKNKIRFRHYGRKDRLPKKVVEKLKEFEEETKDYSNFHFQLCLDYGGRDEIIRAIQKIPKEEIQNMTEESFKKYLDQPEIPEAELIIRTSGEVRLSGFFLYECAYSELYFLEKHFPDFSPNDLEEAVKKFSKRNRRFGGDDQ